MLICGKNNCTSDSECLSYFLSNEEKRMHVHIECQEGEAKFWLEPIVSLAAYYALSGRKLNEIHKIVEDRKNEIIKEWKKHFSI